MGNMDHSQWHSFTSLHLMAREYSSIASRTYWDKKVLYKE